MDDGFFDGLTRAEAIALCVRRHNELDASALKFVQKLDVKEKRPNQRETLRLSSIVRRLRQGDLVAAATRHEEVST